MTHSMENVIYNELRMRGFHVDVGNLTVIEKGKDTKPVKKQLEVDFICNKGSKNIISSQRICWRRKQKWHRKFALF